MKQMSVINKKIGTSSQRNMSDDYNRRVSRDTFGLLLSRGIDKESNRVSNCFL